MIASLRSYPQAQVSTLNRIRCNPIYQSCMEPAVASQCQILPVSTGHSHSIVAGGLLEMS